MLETFNTSATTQSTLGAANWNGEIGDIRESIRKVNELAKRNAGREDAKPADLIVFTPEAFDEIEQHQSPPVASDKPLETIGGIEFEIVAGDIPAMLRSMQVACLGKRVILVTKGDVGLCVRQYYFPDDIIKPHAIPGGGQPFDLMPRMHWSG